MSEATLTLSFAMTGSTNAPICRSDSRVFWRVFVTVLAVRLRDALGWPTDASAHVLSRLHLFEVPDVHTWRVAAQVVEMSPWCRPLSVLDEPCDAVGVAGTSAPINDRPSAHHAVSGSLSMTNPFPTLIGTADIHLRPEPLGNRFRGWAFGHGCMVAQDWYE